ncbi:hypothetical protein SKAU_G00018370 [Synaphobranchus kaupii]|uniref:Uncharacterized protein n=1 Tax=Synaphobranchus kaupii TaxID=118154 RepID=A0A9Q1JE99_SYNKA|nr:hypothetical protein SKAU_G00018370 [Synaphobranchus kaupii]
MKEMDGQTGDVRRSREHTPSAMNGQVWGEESPLPPVYRVMPHPSTPSYPTLPFTSRLKRDYDHSRHGCAMTSSTLAFRAL